MGFPSIRPFPAGPVRDTLGLVRLLWVLEQDGTDLDRPRALLLIGETLRDTLRQGRLDPESMGYRAAVRRAVEAVDRLEALEWGADKRDMVRLAAERVRGGERPRMTEREERRQAEAVRR